MKNQSKIKNNDCKSNVNNNPGEITRCAYAVPAARKTGVSKSSKSSAASALSQESSANKKNKFFEFESEEQEYREAFAGVDIKAEFNRKKTPDEEAEMLEYQQAAKNFFKKDARVNFRISQHDLNLLKHKANMEGMPYQTMLGSLVHKFVNNII